MFRVDVIGARLYNALMHPLTHFADVYQGMARAGRAAGARPGPWRVRLVESGEVRGDGWLDLSGLREISLERNGSTLKHLLRPHDVLVTARASAANVVLVPSDMHDTVAGVTMLVVRPKRPDPRMSRWIWYFLTSSHGQTQMRERLNVNATVTSLSARSLVEVELPEPTERDLDALARLADASEAAYTASLDAARLRRDVLRDAIVAEIGRKSG